MCCVSQQACALLLLWGLSRMIQWALQASPSRAPITAAVSDAAPGVEQINRVQGGGTRHPSGNIVFSIPAERGIRSSLHSCWGDNNTHLSKVACVVRSFHKQTVRVRSILPPNGLALGLVNTDSIVLGWSKKMG